MFPRIGRPLLFRAALTLPALTGLVTAGVGQFSMHAAAHVASAMRLASATGRGTVPSTGGGAAMAIEFVDSLHGFGLNPLPAINDGGFAASPSLLLSTADGGKSWRSRMFPPADGEVSAISFVSPRTGWAVSFISPGGSPQRAAILATTNAGASWTSEALPTSLPNLMLFQVDFVDALHGWAIGTDFDNSGTHSVVLATTDGGRTWSPETLAASPANGQVDALSFSSDTVGWAIGNTPSAPFILHTGDGGASWTVQPTPAAVTQLSAVRALGSDAWAVGSSTGSSGVLIKSQNGGPWQIEPTPSSGGFFDISFSDSANGWALGVGTGGASLLIHTIDGGATWASTSAAPPLPFASAVAAAATGAWVIGGGACGLNAAIAQTTSGASWATQLAMAPAAAQFGPVSFPAVSTGYMITERCGYHLLRSTDSGVTWLPTAPFPAVIQATALAFPTPSRGWVVGDTFGGSVIYTTADGAASWTAQTLPTGFSTLGPVAFGDSMHGWIVGEDQNFNATLVGTSDGGSHWVAEPIPSGIGFLSAIAAAGASDVWAVGGATGGGPTGGSPVLIASTNGGTSWTSQPLPSGLQSLQSLGFVDTLHGWAVGSDATSKGAIIATSDGGSTWLRQTSAPATGNLTRVSFASASVGWALGAQSLLTTSNGGATWTQQSLLGQLPYPDDLRALTSRTVVMTGTNPFDIPGVARSGNGGSSWSSAAVFDPAWLSESPTSGSVGTSITLTGHGFDANEPVTVRWISASGTTLATVTSDPSGAFTVSFTVPSTTTGSHRVYALGRLSLAAPYVGLTVR